jgi:hypothetical protein
MTILYVPWIHLYVGWEPLLSARKPHICCTKKVFKANVGAFELVWDWFDTPSLHDQSPPKQDW